MTRKPSAISELTTELQKMVDAEFDHLARLEQRRNKSDVKVEKTEGPSELSGEQQSASGLDVIESFSAFLRTRDDADQILEQMKFTLVRPSTVQPVSAPPPPEASHA